MKKLLLVFVVLVAVACAAGYVLYGRVNEAYRGYSDNERYVEIQSGLGTRAIGDRLVAAGVVRDPLTFRVALWMSGNARKLQAGEYRFDHPMTPRDVIGKIARGDVELVKVTFPEGLTVEEMSRVFGESGLGTAKDFLAAARATEIVDAAGMLEKGDKTVEGYLFPDTYAVSRRTTALQLVYMMLDKFWHVVDENMQLSAAGRGMSIHELVTLASLVEKETASPDERPIVAGVYANRLKIGMALQCDPTVIYALQRTGKFTGNLRRDDLAYDSRYNTYRYPGLPPGPIAAPGRTSLKAAANPAAVDYLYFVSRNDGTHEFASTLAEHNQNVQKYQVQYFRKKR